MSTFQIVISLCLLTFLLVTGCNDMTQSNSHGLNAQIIKEIKDSESDMAKKNDENVGMTTTVEIVRKESLDENKGNEPVENVSSEPADSTPTEEPAATPEKLGAEDVTTSDEKLAQASVAKEESKQPNKQAAQ